MRRISIFPAAAVCTVMIPVSLVVSHVLSEPTGTNHVAEAGPVAIGPSYAPPSAWATSDPIAQPSRAAGASAPLTAAEEDLVSWAVDRFALVGLHLPHVDITFHDDTGPCGGNEGRFRGSGEQREIAVCVPDRKTFASHLQRQRTVVHELAHAWEHAHFDAGDRTALLAVLDAASWYAPEDEWDKRGVERFAETIVWGLYDQPRRHVLIDVPCRELHADFQAITGVSAPGPLEPVCHLASPPSSPNLRKGRST